MTNQSPLINMTLVYSSERPGKLSTPSQDSKKSKLGFSIVLGGVAGMIAVIVVWDDLKVPNIILGLLAACYAGSDFLECITKWLPKQPVMQINSSITAARTFKARRVTTTVR